MPILIVGSTGGVGFRVVKKLLSPEFDEIPSCKEIRVLCRNLKSIDDSIKNNARAKFIQGTLLEMKTNEIQELVRDCDAVISCLGHRMPHGNIFNGPLNLVLNSAKKLVNAAKEVRKNVSAIPPIKFIWISAAGVGHPDGRDEKMRSVGAKLFLAFLWLMMPMHRDNFRTAYFFYEKLGKENKDINWSLVRPGNLTDEKESEYEVYDSLQQGLFSQKNTARANVAAFMAQLATNDEIWTKYKNELPVVVNK